MELLPCPFCGGEAVIERYGDRRQSTIYACTDCGCRLETGETEFHGCRWNGRDEMAAIMGEKERDRRKRLRDQAMNRLSS